MKVALVITVLSLMLALASCRPLNPEVTSQDCIVPVPANFTRIYIGTPASGGPQSGTSFADPLDGTTADKFDAILRSISEGQHPSWGSQTNIPPENLIVCLTSGIFQTNGQYDWELRLGHTQGRTLGFTVERNWKIHGRGVRRTQLQLASYVPDQFVDKNGVPFSGGHNVAIGTHSSTSSGVEISDLTIDANHDNLTGASGVPLDLQAIVLRSTEGGHWIHDVNVFGSSGDEGLRNLQFETVAVRIWGDSNLLEQQSSGNIIEHVSVTNPGRPVVSGSRPGGALAGIAVNNAVAEIRNNLVDGYPIGYGGWSMVGVQFHDNIAKNGMYGFNADSFNNTGVVLQSNQFIRPSSYGIVIGGSPPFSFSGWTVSGNTIQLGSSGSAIVLRGQVQNSIFTNNTISADSGNRNMIAIWSYPSASGAANSTNTFQDNHIDKALEVNFSQDPNFNTDCRFQNRDLQGQVRPDFPDNSSSACH